MATVKYQSLTGEWLEVEPLKVYELVSSAIPSKRNPERVQHTAEPEKITVKNFEAFFDLGLRVLASEPFFINKASIPWMMTYVDHLTSLIRSGMLGRRRGWRDQLRNHIRNRRSFIYLTRLVGALDFLVHGLIDGKTWATNDIYGDLYCIRALIDEKSPAKDLLKALTEVMHFFEEKSVKAELTRERATDSFVRFVIPDGEYIGFETREGYRKYSAGSVGAGHINRFHLSEGWSDINVKGYPGYEGGADPCYLPFQVFHQVSPINHHPSIEAMPIGGEYYGLTLLIPHEWIEEWPAEADSVKGDF
jgi:hypothetical protein